MPQLSDILAHNPGCVVREVDEGLIIMPPEVTTTHSLNNLSSFIWNQLDGKRDLAAVLASILAEYSVTEEKALADLLPFAEELLSEGLVEEVNQAG